MSTVTVPETTFHWTNDSDPAGYDCLWTPLLEILAQEKIAGKRRVFDLGCGNGLTAAMLAERGYEPTGVDPSPVGIGYARERVPHGTFEVASGYEDLAARFRTFPVVICMEVIEHCYYPRRLARTFLDLIAPQGLGILTTPYHGYVKNLAISIIGKWDRHFGSLNDSGHIKFFSINTLRHILENAGATDVRFRRTGRVPPLARSLIAVVRKPAGHTQKCNLTML